MHKTTGESSSGFWLEFMSDVCEACPTFLFCPIVLGIVCDKPALCSGFCLWCLSRCCSAWSGVSRWSLGDKLWCCSSSDCFSQNDAHRPTRGINLGYGVWHTCPIILHYYRYRFAVNTSEVIASDRSLNVGSHTRPNRCRSTRVMASLRSVWISSKAGVLVNSADICTPRRICKHSLRPPKAGQTLLLW